MIEAKEKKIGTTVYRVSQLGAVTGRGVFVRLVRLLGGALNDPAGGVGAAFAKVASSLTEEDLAFFCDTFASQTTLKIGAKSLSLAGEGVFDTHFAGRYLDMAQWLRFCIEVNFGSVFTGLAAAVGRGTENLAASASPSESPSPLTGTSAAS